MGPVRIEGAGMPEDFRVLQSYEEIGGLIYEAAIDNLTDDGGDITTSHLPVPPEVLAWAEPIARRIRDDVLMVLDGAEPVAITREEQR